MEDGPAALPPSLDFVTARTEFYEHPSALPQVERSSIRQDLHRRDFTINTLAIQLTPRHFGELLDFYGGEHDLRQGLIRVLHSLSFVEDPTRMLRAARLEQRLGFRIESRTAELLSAALDLLDRVSGERIYHELHLIFQETEPERSLRRLDELGVLRRIHPELRVDDWVIQRMTTLRTGLSDTPWASTRPTDAHYLGLLLAPVSEAAWKAISTRLRLRSAEVSVVRQVHSLLTGCLPQLQQPLRPSHIYRLLEPFDSDSLLVGWLVCEDDVGRAQLAQFQRELRGIKPLIDGDYLRHTLGIPPTPLYREIIDGLRSARLDGQLLTLADEQAWLEQWLRQHGPIKRARKPAA
jgi:tRNA nucleotidyltransferase (CCA-adding enzyme)